MQLLQMTGSAQSATDQVRALARLTDDLGLPPEPLPEIEDDDVHLVCWLAITGRERD